MDDTTAVHDGAADAALVAAALAGERKALASIYDRYADRIHTMCVHLLGDRDEAADVCGEVFLVAFQRLGQLRDATRLRAWLFAIARHEVYRRTRRRSRVRLVEEVSEMERMQPVEDSGDTAVDAAALTTLVREAALGLDDRDRLVLELQLQDLGGPDLAAALGVSTSTAYQHVHRMRERMERSLGALLVARQGRDDCGDLDRLLQTWDGHFSVLWRKRVARHVDGCEVCERRRKGVPAALLGSVGASPLVAAPTSVRTRVLGAVQVGTAGARGGWRSDGFPPADPAGRRPLLGLVAAVAVAAVVVGLVLLAAGWWPGGEEQVDVVAAARSVTSAPSSPTTTPATSATTSAPSPPTTAAALPPAGPTTMSPTTAPGGATPTTRPTATTPTTRAAPTTVPATATTVGAPTTVPVTTTTAAPPTVRLSPPARGVLYADATDGAACANDPFVATIAPATSVSAVTLRWSAGAASGSTAMTRTRSTWSATLRVPAAVAGVNGTTLTATAQATVAGGSTGTSGAVTVRVLACPVIG